ncbi:hypothetical protein R84B8_02433 [Treponema sp. R8-4-B8]
MANKIRFLITAILLIGLCLPFAFGQSNESSSDEDETEQQNYYIDRNENDSRFIQRLIWTAADYVFRYEVIVEKQDDDGNYNEVERVSVKQNFAEVSLTAGKYRYRVDIYDLVNNYASSSDWHDFEIIRALQPELTNFNPRFFYLDEDNVWEINLQGQNLLPNSEIYLVQNGSKIRPQRHIANGDSARLVFSGRSLVIGEYSIYVKNPGGLDVQLGPFVITNKKPFDLNISLGYAPFVPLYGYIFKDSDNFEAPFIDSFYPQSATFKISYIPIKHVWGYLGAEISGALSFFRNERKIYSTQAFFLNTHLSVLYQKYFFKKAFAVNVNLGAGFSTLLDFYYKYSSGYQGESIINIIPSITFDLSFLVFVFNPFYIRIGVDFIHAFTSDNPMPGFIIPFVVAGIQL